MLEEFFRIFMITQSGKKCYLKESEKGKGGCSWSFSPEPAIWFETNKEAELFCKKYFKKFHNYKIESFKYFV